MKIKILSSLVFVILALVGCSHEPEPAHIEIKYTAPPPGFSIVCDTNGHFSYSKLLGDSKFIFGEHWDDDVFATREQALEKAWRHYRVTRISGLPKSTNNFVWDDCDK